MWALRLLAGATVRYAGYKPAAASGLARTFTSAGAFPLAPASADAALFLALDSGSYTVQITDPDNRSGTSLLELYLAP